MTTTADRFHALHAGPDVLVLPNAWDAASAALMEDAGARAVATSSAAVAWGRGYADGDALPVSVLIDVVAGIARVIKVPLTADIEGGYTDDLPTLAETIKAVVGAGAVGVNLEDGLRDPTLHARKVETARTAAGQAGVNLFINARTDVYLKGLAGGEAALAETLRRAALYAEAGASGIFVPMPVEEDLLSKLAAGIALPVNAMGRPGMPSASRLARLGVRRLSSATGPFRAAYGAMLAATRTYLEDGDTTGFAASGKDLPDLNDRFG
ncbi:PEP phosphonomutase [Caulobacter sp. Root1455]|uniref:isocitrate lyase/PEP mutase family protein n=1 Tax=unclassified Caulobacter TaxID=2648921 RepID=UPI0006FCA91A|nr:MULTISPECIES: isocitrate lyase/phosphoenolpyruvate mutase family protein [unclassified Caulobacter]KQY29596.1 PEP phosphonomutase [Caulobacter sp. Root487D2Y]KQY95822.1 PEP phosphonomutase [Caulobacter sp. Root1455]